VWTVFRGTEAEPFDVEVTGVVAKCARSRQVPDSLPADRSASAKHGRRRRNERQPLYIEGKLAGALSYQIQRFETVRYAGFTPAADLAEVRDKPDLLPSTLPTLPSLRSRTPRIFLFVPSSR